MEHVERINDIKINMGRCTDYELKMLAGYTMRRALDARHDLDKVYGEYARRRAQDSVGGANTPQAGDFHLEDYDHKGEPKNGEW